MTLTPDFKALANEVKDRGKMIYKPTGEGSRWYDQNASNRSRVVSGLQYSEVEFDEETLVFLFEQELLRAKNDPFQGMGEDLEYLAFLLSQKRNPSHSRLFLRAKTANFDCHCGFDSFYLVSSGFSELEAYLGSENPPEKAQLQEFLGNWTQEDVEELEAWRQDKERYFLREWLDEEPSYRIFRLNYLGFEQLAQNTLKQWESQSPSEIRELQSLSRAQKELGSYLAVARTSDKLLALDLSQSDRISEWGEKTEALCRAGQFERALISLDDYCQELRQLDGWNRLGFGREACRRAFLLAVQRFPGQQKAFELAEDLFGRLSMTPLAIIELGYLAARSQGPLKAVARYERLAEKEAARIQQEWNAAEALEKLPRLQFAV